MPAPVMHFYSGSPMHLLSGVDSRRVIITRLQKWMGHSFPEYTAQYVAELLRQAPELLGDERADAERMW
jgi:hypothetical protein